MRDHLCIYHDNLLIARHVRSYDRRQDLLDIELAQPDLSHYGPEQPRDES